MANPIQVSEVVHYVKRQLDDDPILQQLAVIGEISNFKRYASGHCYFTLKDESSRMKAVMFSRDARTLNFEPKDGMNVIVVARVTMYESTGDIQLYVELMRQDGIGMLFERYEARKRELEAKGWFAAERKRPLPAFPERIGIVTSPKGAALHDIATTLRRRAPHVAITFAPVAVQGDQSAPQVASAIRWMNERTDCDVLIVGRGGGSIEELWAFNEDVVVEAIYESRIPVISAVGHETDFTLADFVADVRAATPTAAAELATATIEAQRKDVERLSSQFDPDRHESDVVDSGTARSGDEQLRFEVAPFHAHPKTGAVRTSRDSARARCHEASDACQTPPCPVPTTARCQEAGADASSQR